MKKIFTLVLSFIAVSLVVALVANKIINRIKSAEDDTIVAVESESADLNSDGNAEVDIESETPNPADQPVSFNLIDENGAAFTGDSLKGKISIVNFVFRSCKSICPFLMSKTRGVATDLLNYYDQIQLVSITVDPTNDTPAVLKEWKTEVAVKGLEWKFLTGDKTAILTTVRDQFKQSVMENAGNMDMPIAHSSYLALVGADGRVAGYFDSNDGFKIKELTEAAAKLAADLKSTSVNH